MMRREYRKHLVMLFVLALVLRVSFVLFANYYLSIFSYTLVSDPGAYHHLAKQLATSGSYQVSAGKPTAYRPVGYPAFLAAIYSLVGPWPFAVCLVQSLFLSCVPVLVYLMIRRLGGDIQAAYRGGLFMALWPPQILLACELYSQALFVPLFTCSVALALWILGHPSHRPKSYFALLIGVITGLAALVRTEAVIILLGLIALLLSPQIRKRRLVAIALVACGFMITVAPWVARNYFVMGKPCLALNLGINLYYGFNAQTDGGWHALPRQIEAELAAMEESQRDRALTILALDFIRSYPLRAIALSYLKAAKFLGAEWQIYAMAGGRGGDVQPLYPLALDLLVYLIFATLWYTLVCLGIAGATLLRKNPNGVFLVIVMALFTTVYLVIVGGDIYHEPLVPLLCTSAALFVHAPILSSHSKVRRTITAALIVLALLPPLLQEALTRLPL